MEKIKEEQRQATYTISVPMQITFVANNSLTADEFAKIVEKEVMKRLANGYFDVFPEQYDILKKHTHYTAEEERRANEFFATFFKGLRGLR